MRSLAIVLALVALAACVPSASVTPSGRDLKLAPRPADCEIEIFRTKAPERPYDEVATLAYSSFYDTAPVYGMMRQHACSLGADAVIMTRESGYEIVGTAVSYRDARELHRLEYLGAVARGLHAQQRWADQAEAEVRAGGPRPPTGFSPAKVREGARPRAFPDRMAPEGASIPPGTVVWTGPEDRDGFRRLWKAGTFLGYVQGTDLELDQAPSRPAPPPLRGTDI